MPHPLGAALSEAVASAPAAKEEREETVVDVEPAFATPISAGETGEEWVSLHPPGPAPPPPTHSESRPAAATSSLLPPAPPSSGLSNKLRKQTKPAPLAAAKRDQGHDHESDDDDDDSGDNDDKNTGIASFGGLPVQGGGGGGGGGGPRTLELVFGIALADSSLQSAMRQPGFEAELKQKLFAELQAISPLPLALLSLQVHLGRDQVTMAVSADGPVAAAMFWAPIRLSVAGHAVTLKQV